MRRSREAYILADAAEYMAPRRGERPDAVMARALPLIDAALARDPKSARGTTLARSSTARSPMRRRTTARTGAAVTGNKFYERQVTPLVAELDAMK